MEPVKYPTVIVGGEAFLLRFEMNALFRLNSWGFNVDDIRKTIEEFTANGQSVVLVTTLVASALGRIVDGQWKGANLDPQGLADRLKDGEFANLAEAISNSMGKASLDETSAPTQPATMEQTSKLAN